MRQIIIAILIVISSVHSINANVVQDSVIQDTVVAAELPAVAEVATPVDKSALLLGESQKWEFSFATLLRGLLGIVVLVFLAWLLSSNRKNIQWKNIAIALAFQVALAISVLKLNFVRWVFEFFGKIFVVILDFTKAGTNFLFEGFLDVDKFGYVFAFQVLPTIIFFSALTSLLFYFGVIQIVVKGLAYVFSRLMGLSGAEALSVAGKYFSRANRIAIDDQSLFVEDEQFRNATGHVGWYGHDGRRGFGCLHCHAGR
jgi:CNT family concentrative nucleoside transporter